MGRVDRVRNRRARSPITGDQGPRTPPGAGGCCFPESNVPPPPGPAMESRGSGCPGEAARGIRRLMVARLPPGCYDQPSPLTFPLRNPKGALNP